MKNILITGSKGQLGMELARQLAGFFPVLTDVDEMDILNKSAIEKIVRRKNIEVIINCAGYTNVEKAEDDPETAYNINAIGVRNLAEVSKEKKLKLIHISTDYVYDGQANSAYTEEDATNPLSVYGRTKLQGENFIIDNCDDYIIVRTSWLYGKDGANFVKTMLNLFTQKEEISVVADQIGSPTNTKDLAKAIIKLLRKNCKGIYNISGEGVCSWKEFAREIAKLSGSNCKIVGCDTASLHQKAIRPKYSVLSKEKLNSEGVGMRGWKAALREFLESDIKEI